MKVLMKFRKMCIMWLIILIITLGASAVTLDQVSVTGYDTNANYLALMQEAAEDGSDMALVAGAAYEAARNLKIDTEKLNISKTFFFSENVSGSAIAFNIKNYIYHKKGQVFYNEEDATMLAKIIYAEARGISSTTEKACVVWTILNRVDHNYGTITEVITAPNQFAWYSNTPITDEYLTLAYDILDRWNLEQNGETDVGRVLPKEYLYFSGHSGHNWFRVNFANNGEYWDYSWSSPYND